MSPLDQSLVNYALIKLILNYLLKVITAIQQALYKPYTPALHQTHSLHSPLKHTAR